MPKTNEREWESKAIAELNDLNTKIQDEAYLCTWDKNRGLTGAAHKVALDNLKEQYNLKFTSFIRQLELDTIARCAGIAKKKKNPYANTVDIISNGIYKQAKEDIATAITSLGK